MPPPEKKAKTSAEPQDDDVEASINRIRHEGGRRFLGSEEHINCNIEHVFREIRALLQINSEIFTRCMLSVDAGYSGKSATFNRVGYDVVRVRQNPTNDTLTEFVTNQEQSQQTFSMELLSELPSHLSNIFVAQHQAPPFQVFIDYSAFFETAITMLRDDVLEPFLVKLKRHLESIQVCLGEIESWLREPKENIQFLEKIFGTNLESSLCYADFTTTQSNHDLFSGTLAKSQPPLPKVNEGFFCLRCKDQFGSHIRTLTTSEHKPRISDNGKPRISNYGKPRISDWDSFAMYKFRCPDKIGYYYTDVKVGKPLCQILKECRDSGKFERTFTIANTNEREKLLKFLEFIG